MEGHTLRPEPCLANIGGDVVWTDGIESPFTIACELHKLPTACDIDMMIGIILADPDKLNGRKCFVPLFPVFLYSPIAV